jgi:hypothetical protein
MMVEMSDDVVRELLSAIFKLGALQFRLGIIATEAMLTFGNRAKSAARCSEQGDAIGN